MTVSDVSKSLSLGQSISGRVYAGAAAVGDSVSEVLTQQQQNDRVLYSSHVPTVVTVFADANRTPSHSKRSLANIGWLSYP